MATHDYNLANQSGASFRSDLNDALQAVLTNNSSASAPSTTAAYMFWADTNTGILKIRNSANDGWVELLQLDGTLTLEDGSASAVALGFRDELNTGIFSSGSNNFDVSIAGTTRLNISATGLNVTGGITTSDDLTIPDKIIHSGDTNTAIRFPAADTFTIETAGSERVRVDSSGNCGIGTDSPTVLLDLESTTPTIRLTDSDATGTPESEIRGGGGDLVFSADRDDEKSSTVIEFHVDGSEKVRIDTNGRTLISNSSARASGGVSGMLQVERADSNGAINIVQNQNNAAGSPSLILAKSRGTSVGSNTVVANNDTLGAVKFAGADGTDLNTPAAQITGQVDGTPGSDDMPGRLVFSTTADGASSVTERMRIASDGVVSVGINDNNPAQLKIIYSTVPTFLTSTFDGTVGEGTLSINVPRTADGSASWGSHSNTNYGSSAIQVLSHVSTGGYVAFLTSSADNTNPTEKVRVSGAGHFLFNCTSLPSSSVAGMAFEKNGSSGVLFHSNGSSTSSINVGEFINGNGTVGTINTSGSATSYNTSSDYRLKENAVAISDGITRLKTLKPYRFNFKADPSTTVDGFFAHEVTAVPEAITGTKDEVDSDNNPIYQGIDQSKLVPLLVAAVQELIGKVAALEAA